MKKLLMIIQSDPYESSKVAEAIDMAYAGAAFDIEVGILFTGEGLLCLIEGQSTSNIESKSIEKKIQALPIYGVDSIWYEPSESYSIATSDLATAVSPEERQQIMSSFDEIQVF